MSKPKWAPTSRPVTLLEFLGMSPTTIIYDSRAHRGTQAGILWGMTYRTVVNSLASNRYFYAKRLDGTEGED